MIQLFAELPINPAITALPKADIHVHAEWSPRLDRVLARKAGHAPYNWRGWAEHLMQSEPPGQDRLRHISMTFPATIDLDADNFLARVVDLLEEAAADGAILVETRFGKDLAERRDCLSLFREAERQVQQRYPQFHAEVIPFLDITWERGKVESLIRTYIAWAKAGLLYGIDLFNRPYDTEADWTEAYRIADAFAMAGLGITVHVAEVSTANLEAVLKLPGLTRLGHATHAGYHPRLLELVAKSGVTVECALTCNVILGAAESYEQHPIRQFVEMGIPVALCTDDPVQMCTTIGREYQIAGLLGFSVEALRGFTRNAVNAAFISPTYKTNILEKI